MSEQKTQHERIRQLNDAFRVSLRGGMVMLTRSVTALSEEVQALAVGQVVAFDAFTEDNDPHREHDFGSFELAGHKFFWKIDYYDKQMEYGSPDPSNPAVTTRVLTIMLASDY